MDQGADVSVDFVGPTCTWDLPIRPGAHAPLVANVVDCKPVEADVVVLQRPGRKHWTQVIPHIQRHGTKVVIDVDDLFSGIHRGNLAAEMYEKPDHNHRWIRKATSRADLVTVSTAALQREYGGTVLPNMVPEKYLQIRGRQMDQVAGWSGSVATHPEDLEVTGGGYAAMAAERGWSTHIIGTGKGVRDALGLLEEPTATGWVSIAEYPRRLRKLALGIVPLADNPFNEAKSALKIMEMASLGVPVVASPIEDNWRMHAHGIGVLARTPVEWAKQCDRLMRSAELRAELAGRGRTAMTDWTYEKRCGLWWDAWTSPA